MMENGTRYGLLDARNPSGIDAKCGDHFPQADLSLPIGPTSIGPVCRQSGSYSRVATCIEASCATTYVNSAFFVPVLIETIHTWASFIDSDSLMARATCNCGRVRREHFGKWPPGRQESCGSRSTAEKRTVFLRPKSR